MLIEKYTVSADWLSGAQQLLPGRHRGWQVQQLSAPIGRRNCRKPARWLLAMHWLRACLLYYRKSVGDITVALIDGNHEMHISFFNAAIFRDYKAFHCNRTDYWGQSKI